MRRRRFFVPEVVQTSAMDCGPACLSALLGGFGIYAGYGRLREACQTGLDGTSVDTIEELAQRLGLEAEQIVVPADHVALPEAHALPAMTVVKLNSGMTHFVVAWSRHGQRLQIMDPATGRRWTAIHDLIKELYAHQMVVPAAAWREWTESDDFAGALKARLRALHIGASKASALVASAHAQPTWRAIATLDAGVRMLQSLARSGAPLGRRGAARMLTATVERACDLAQDPYRIIPPQYWSVRPADQEQLVATGAVVVRIRGRRDAPGDLTSLPPEVATAMTEPPPRPALALLRLLKQDGILAPAILCVAIAVSVVGTMLQALFFRALMEGGKDLAAQGQRLGAIGALLALMLILLAIEIPASALMVGMGRRLETRFRTAFLMKLPRIVQSYFQSRLTSDMGERSHSIQYLRVLPVLAGQLLRSVFELLLTTAGVIWIDPSLWPAATASAVIAVALPLAVQPLLGEREMRMRTHTGALSRFYLDALLGLVPIRTHVADGIIRTEHRALLARWAAAGLATQKIAIALEGVQTIAGFGLAAFLVISHLARHPESSALLLLAYWSLNIPVLGREIATLACDYPMHRNIVLRLLEPLSALESHTVDQASAQPAIAVARRDAPHRGAAISMENVAIVAAGHVILHDISLDIAPGTHVAIVGPSGAGKSSFVGLLNGCLTPAAGTLKVDDAMLSGQRLDAVRRSTAWIDPSIQIWNRPLLDNLRYGLTTEPNMPLAQAVDDAELASVVEKLPEGLQTALGDSGALVSGGEGQRVRVGRALLRPGIRLALLDEPFRGLDAETRRNLLRLVRQVWRGATLLFATHDLADTRALDRVLVMDGGTVVEDGVPAELEKIPGSRYAAMLRREDMLKKHLLRGIAWRRLEMRQGNLREDYDEGDLVTRTREMTG